MRGGGGGGQRAHTQRDAGQWLGGGRRLGVSAVDLAPHGALAWLTVTSLGAHTRGAALAATPAAAAVPVSAAAAAPAAMNRSVKTNDLPGGGGRGGGGAGAVQGASDRVHAVGATPAVQPPG
jgi:hypothetical protein